MAKPCLLLLCCLVFGLYSTAQTLSPSVLANDGGIAETENVILEWTLGETLIATHHGDRHIYTEGYHQPELQVVSLEPASRNLDINVFPNPVNADLAIQIGGPVKEEIRVDLMDMNGTILIQKFIQPLETKAKVDLENLPSSTYLLRFTTEKGEMTQTFKISKIH